MIRLAKSLSAWGTPDFNDTLKQEIEQLGAGQLPLQQGMSAGNQALDEDLGVMIISVVEQADRLRAKVGLFYAGIITGCSCADDPTPVSPHNEYCVVQLDIDKLTAETTVALLEE